MPQPCSTKRAAWSAWRPKAATSRPEHATRLSRFQGEPPRRPRRGPASARHLRDEPTHPNLRVPRAPRASARSSPTSRIRPGSLHQASAASLVVARPTLMTGSHHLGAHEACPRAAMARRIRSVRSDYATTLKPVPVPIRVRVVLVGAPTSRDAPRRRSGLCLALPREGRGGARHPRTPRT